MWFTHISGHPSATGRAQDSESTPAKDRCYTAGPHNQLNTPTVACGYRSERDFTEAGHPDVAGDVHTYPVVPLLGGEVVIPDKHDLHPTFPLLRLIPVHRPTPCVN